MDVPSPIQLPTLPPLGALRAQLASAPVSSGEPSGLTPILQSIPIVGGLLGSIFGSSPQPLPPTALNSTINLFRALFPDQNAPMCGFDIAVDNLNGGIPTTLNIPCDDAQFGLLNRAGLEWLIKNAGIAAVLAALAHFMRAKPLLASPTGGGSGGTSSVDITNIVNVTDASASTAVQNVADAVKQGIAAATSAANDATSNITKEITSNLDTTAKLLSDFTGAFTTQIPQFFGQLVTGLMSPFGAIQSSLEADINTVGHLLSSIESSVLLPLGGLIQSQTAGLGAIEQTISGQLGVLGGDIGQLVTSLLPGVSDGLNNIEKVLERLGTIWTKVSDSIHFETIDLDLKRLGDEIAGIAAKTIGVGITPDLKLPSGCDVEQFKSILADWTAELGNAPFPINWLLKWVKATLLVLGEMGASVGFMFEQGKEILYESCPLTRLDANLVVSLWRRGILDGEAAKAELTKLGYAASRQTALYDSTIAQLQLSQILSMWWRGIIDNTTVAGELGKQGYTSSQITALQDLSQQPSPVQDTITGWLRGTLDESEVDLAVKAAQFSKASGDLAKANARRPPTTEEILAGENTRSVLGSFTLPNLFGLGTDWDSIPQWYKDAGKAEGLNDEAIQQRWWAHWQIPDPGTAIQQYFRGLRSEQEVGAIMDRYFVPKTLQVDLINVSRPLIPLRSVGSMLVNNVLNKDEARHVLEMHGMDDTSIDKMIHYALLAKPKASTTVATTAHATSISSARTLFEDGAITEQQYREILTEHDLTPSAIDAELQVATIQETIKQRKQAGADIVNEYQAGLIDLPTAKQNLAQLNFTVAEQAKYAKQLRAAKTAVSKVPSEGDLNHFLQNSIITGDEYTAALEAAGYSEQWAKAFLQFRTKPTPTQNTGAAPTPPPTGA